MENGFKGFIEKQYALLVSLATLAFILFTVATSLGLLNGGNPKKLSLVPGPIESLDSIYEAATYSDRTDPGGASTITPVYHNENSMKFSYTVNQGYEYPYAGLSLHANTASHKIENPIDISTYSDVLLDISAKNASELQMYIKPVIPDFTIKNDKSTRGHIRYDIPLENGEFTGRIKLADFFTPDWWYANHKVKKADLSAPDMSQVIEIVFQSGSDMGKNVDVTIREITFSRDLKMVTLTAILLYLLVLVLLASIKFIKRPVTDQEEEDDGSEKIVISYDRVEIEDEQNNDLQRITEYIASNYSNPDFSVEQLAKGAGVSTSRIPTLLKKQYSMNFKQYLNTVRITEAKRLLLDTDHQIVTIAHSVGYNNIPHFNRTFKQVTGLSPKKYRENPEEAIDNLPGTASNKEQ